MISGYIEITANSFGRNLTIQTLFNPAVTLVAVVRSYFLQMRFNARRSLSVSLEVQPELRRLLNVSLGFSNSVMVLDMVALEKPSRSTVLVTEAPTIRAPIIHSNQSQLGNSF